MNRPLLDVVDPSTVSVVLSRIDDTEVDEMWSYVGKKQSRDGCGMPSITEAERSWRTSLAVERTRYL